MSKHSDLLIDHHNALDDLMTEYRAHTKNARPKPPRCAKMAIYDSPTPAKHIHNALAQLETFTASAGTWIDYEYIRLQLTLALSKLPKETTR